MEKVSIVLTDGRKINLELYREMAPASVENFLQLAKEGFYSGLCFHRVISGFMVQGGGFTAAKDGRLQEKRAQKTIKGEFACNGFNQNTLKHTAGVISMARTNVADSATSQFFICVADCKFLDGQYAAFGKTTDEESTKVAVDISKVKTATQGYYDDVPVTPVVIDKVEIL